MTDGAQSLAGDGRGPLLRLRQGPAARQTWSSPGRIICYRPYEVKDGWVTCGALEPKFWAAWCRGVGREDLIEQQFEPAGLRRPRRGRPRSSSAKTREEWRAFNDEHDCCDRAGPRSGRGARAPSWREAREMVVELEQPELGAVRQLGFPVKLSRTPAAIEKPGSGARRAHRRAARGGRLLGGGDPGARGAGRGQGTRRRTEGGGVPRMSAPKTKNEEMLRMGELARGLGRLRGDDQALPARGPASRAGQDLPQHGLLPGRVRRADPPDQAAPGGALHAAAGDQGPARGGPRTRQGPDRARRQAARAGAGGRERAGQRRRGPPPLRRPAGCCSTASPSSRSSHPTRTATRPATSGSSRRSAVSAPAATTSGSASPSTTPFATRSAMAELVSEEVDVLMERLAGEMDADEAMRLIEAGDPATQRPAGGDAHQGSGGRARAPPRLGRRELEGR